MGKIFSGLFVLRKLVLLREVSFRVQFYQVHRVP